MEYQTYERAFQESVIAGIRQEDDLHSEREWLVLSSETQIQMVKALRQEVRNVEDGAELVFG